jgi:hypothetical protein
MADVKKAWRKPELRTLEAGAAETTNTGVPADGAAKGPNKS